MEPCLPCHLPIIAESGQVGRGGGAVRVWASPAYSNMLVIQEVGQQDSVNILTSVQSLSCARLFATP